MIKGLHAIAGDPRAGSTLLCDTFRQDKRLYPSPGTSCVGRLTGEMSQWLSSRGEFKSDMIHSREYAEGYLRDMCRGVAENRYAREAKGKIVIDKDRGWTTIQRKFSSAWPDGVLMICIRDLIDVFASLQRAHGEEALADDSPNLIMQTEQGRFDLMFGPDGFIGETLIGIHDLLQRQPECVQIVKFEEFTADPESTMRELYDAMELDYFEKFRFDNIESKATDCDGLHHYKYRHKTRKKIAPVESYRDQWVTQGIQDQINQKFAWYQQAFEYAERPVVKKFGKKNKKNRKARAAILEAVK